MEFISKLINPGSAAVVLLGAFFITFVGYCLGRISIKGVSLGTAGVFLIALLFGYLFTLPGLQEIPVLSKFFIDFFLSQSAEFVLARNESKSSTIIPSHVNSTHVIDMFDCATGAAFYGVVRIIHT
jgi:hypothetical protein